MKTTLKKLLALILAVILPVCLLSACKQSSDDGSWYSEIVVDQVDNTNQADDAAGDKTVSGEKTSTGKNQQSVGTTDKKTTKTGNVTKERVETSATGGKVIGNNTKIDNPYKADLGGAKIKIYSMLNPFNEADTSVSKKNAAQVKMAQTLEKELNCKIAVETYNKDQIQKLTMMGIASGSYFADVIETAIHTSVGFLTSKYVYDLSKLSTMDLSKSYMNVGNGVDAYHIGKGYWAVGEPIGIAETGSPILYNKRILNELGYKENYIYDLVDAGKWNISTFRKISKQAVKELDGKPGLTAADRYGIIMISIGHTGYTNVLETVGAQMINNKNGVLSYNMTDPKMLNAINLAHDIFQGDDDCIEASDMSGDAAKLFMSGHGLFLAGTYGTMLSSISGMDDDYGLIPFPSADGSGEYRVPTNWNNCCLMVPNNLKGKQLNNAGAFIQAYCYAAQDVVDVMFSEYASRYLCDDESKDNLYRCYNAQKINASCILGGDSNQIHMGTFKVIYETQWGQSPSALIQGTASATKSLVDDIYNKLK